MNATGEAVLRAHFMDGMTLKEIAASERVGVEGAREIITGAWREDRDAGKGHKPRWAVELGWWFDRRTLRWRDDD